MMKTWMLVLHQQSWRIKGTQIVIQSMYFIRMEILKLILGEKYVQNSPTSEQMQLHPGSIILFPGIDNSATNRLPAKAYVSILGNIGIALASLSSIKNN